MIRCRRNGSSLPGSRSAFESPPLCRVDPGPAHSPGPVSRGLATPDPLPGPAGSGGRRIPGRAGRAPRDGLSEHQSHPMGRIYIDLDDVLATFPVRYIHRRHYVIRVLVLTKNGADYTTAPEPCEWRFTPEEARPKPKHCSEL